MKRYIRPLLLLLATALLLALFLQQVSLREVLGEIARANAVELVLALLVTVLNYILRAWRWQVMLAPIGHVGFWNAFKTTVIGFAANFLLPARPGEVLRPYLLARREGLAATATFATIILERAFDLVTVLALFGWFVLVSGDTVGGANPALYRGIAVGGLAAGVASAVGLVVMFVMAGHPERLGRAAQRVERVLPARLASALARLVETFAEGLIVMRRPTHMLKIAALSLPLWLSIAAGIWLVSRAFHITMPFTGSFLISALLTVGVAVPTPGAVGSFHYAFKLGATVFFSATNEAAVGAALVLHAISFIPVTIAGLVFMLQDGLTMSGLKKMTRADGNGSERSAGAKPTLDSGKPVVVTLPREAKEGRPTA